MRRKRRVERIGTVWAAASAHRWHEQHRRHQETWRSAAWGLVTAGVLATGIGAGSMYGGPAYGRYEAFTVTLVGVLLLIAAWRCWRRSRRTPAPSTPRYDDERTVPVDRWKPKQGRRP